MMKRVTKPRMWMLVMVMLCASIPVGGEQIPPSVVKKAEAICGKNLSHLQDKMERLLKSVYVKEFREAIRRSLKASVPEALQHIDGLKEEIESLKREIAYQDRVERSAEFILRELTNTTEGPFKPCRRTEKGGYCETLERFYMAKAANLANRGFLEALECYYRQGVR